MAGLSVLVTGATGQLGTDLMAALSSFRYPLEVHGFGSKDLDVSKRAVVMEAAYAIKPAVIFHLAAMTAVDLCESEREKAFAINALGSRHVVEAADLVGARVVYVSTDYVFDGEKSEPYHEWDVPNPINVYGLSKWAGEKEMRPEDLVVRISWVCGAAGSNIVKTALRLFKEKEGDIPFVNDQRGCPTFTFDAAPVIARLGLEGFKGRIHLSNQGPTTWYEFVREIARLSSEDPGRVVPIRTEELVPKRPAKRPRNSVLENLVLKLEGLDLLPHWRDSLPRLLKMLS